MTLKLLNPINFGPNGTYNCTLELIPFEHIYNVNQIVNSDCNIFFVGNFPIDSMSGSYNPNLTLLPDSTLNLLYQWSTLCSQNLAIVVQEEANRWGYCMENENANPNQPADGLNDFFSIFDGPFGFVSTFNQSGNYQGIITKGPDTGYTLLGEDGNGKATIVLDHQSNDIIACDIDLFTSIGSLSLGDEITSENDKLACNIFALGCQLIEGSIWKHTQYNICRGDQIISPSGEILELEGNYLDTLLVSGACDTIINSQIIFSENEGFYTEKRCQGDGYFLEIGSVIFNENNPIGEVVIPNSFECDSTILVDLDFQSSSTFVIIEHYCENSSYNLVINNNVYDLSNPAGEEIITNNAGCDSIISIDLKFDLPITYGNVVLDFCRESNEMKFVEGVPFSWNSSDLQIFSSNSIGCDSVIDVSINILESSESDFLSTLCENDPSLYIINQTEYGVTNPIGQEIITNAVGCDSIINVFIEVLNSTHSLVEDSLCINSDEVIQIGNSNYGTSNTSGIETIPNNKGCDSIITINISIIDSESTIIDSFQFLSEEENIIDLGLSNDFLVQWIQPEGLSCTNCISPLYNFDFGLENYEIIVIDSNTCQVKHNVKIFQLSSPYIPNAFSPNGDGTNDAFQIFFESSILSQGIEIKRFQILDRWGNVMIENERIPYTNGLELWDGRFNGKLALSGVYIYHLSILFANDTELNFKGDLSLIR